MYQSRFARFVAAIVSIGCLTTILFGVYLINKFRLFSWGIGLICAGSFLLLVVFCFARRRQRGTTGTTHTYVTNVGTNNFNEQLNAQRRQIQVLTEQLNHTQREQQYMGATNMHEQLNTQRMQIQVLTEQLNRMQTEQQPQVGPGQEVRNLGSEVINIR